MWLKVHLTRRALITYKKFPSTACGSFKNAEKALQERFEPKSHGDLYLAEFQTQHKRTTKSWQEFREDLRALVDKCTLLWTTKCGSSWHYKDSYLYWIMNRWHLMQHSGSQGQLRLLLVLHWNVNLIW